ncbi:MAG: DUF1329 domain-containing protein [Pseudomonadota bacterium]|nr:DUF1329 domain-containing protein [Pseudomonadota bacterium]
MTRSTTRVSPAWICAAMYLGLSCAGAVRAELAAGTEISAANWEQVRQETFEGKTIESMVPVSIQKAIKEYNFKIWLKNSEPLLMANHILDATEKYQGTAQYDPQTRQVTGYVAGIPFPDLDAVAQMAPEIAGDLMFYNVFFARSLDGDYSNCYGPYATVHLNTEKGVERVQGAQAIVLRTMGRTSGGPHQIGDDPNLRKLQIITFDSPYDIAGLGVYRKVYADGRLDDIYAYVKAVRRVRRLSGGSWMDTLAGASLLNDDTFVTEAHPMWYPRIELKEKRWILWPVHSDTVVAHDLAEVLDYQNPPYWNFINKNWEPTEVYVLEVTTPEEHPYGKKTLYMNARIPTFHLSETYTKGGEMWRVIYSGIGPHPYDPADGGPGVYDQYNFGVWDFRSEHGNYMDCGRMDANPPDLRYEDFTQRMLVEAADGKRHGLETEFGEGP